MTKEQAKTAVKATAQQAWHDRLTWAITIEFVVSQIFGYWEVIAPVLGAYAPFIQVGLIVFRIGALAYKFYRTNGIKVGGTE